MSTLLPSGCFSYRTKESTNIFNRIEIHFDSFRSRTDHFIKCESHKINKRIDFVMISFWIQPVRLRSFIYTIFTARVHAPGCMLFYELNSKFISIFNVHLLISSILFCQRRDRWVRSRWRCLHRSIWFRRNQRQLDGAPDYDQRM